MNGSQSTFLNFGLSLDLGVQNNLFGGPCLFILGKQFGDIK